LSSSARDLTHERTGRVGASAAARLAGLLTALAEAPDFAAAADIFVAHVAQEAGAPRGWLLTIGSDRETLRAVSALHGGQAVTVTERSLERTDDPLVASALSLVSLSSGDCTALREPALAGWTALALPQVRARGTLPLLGAARVRELLPEATVAEAVEPARRLGLAPFGVLLLERAIDGERLEALAQDAAVAGPSIARLGLIAEFERAREREEQQRELLTTIINSLPDPIVITDPASDIVVQNRRAEHLLTFRETDSEGRRRAVEINNLLFTSFLSRAVMAGGVQSGPRELNLVDPDEGTDLLFEVLAHPLAGDSTRGGSFVSVLRDVTDLRRAAHELERQVQRVRLAEFERTRERDRLNLILENVGDPILVTDDRSNIILMNRQAEQLFDPGEGDPRNRQRVSAVRGNDTKFTSFISDFTISNAQSRREQMRLTRPDGGGDLPVEVVSGKISNARGEPLAIVSVLHDLTKQVENERLYEELKKFSAELEERVRAATADLAEQNRRLQWQARELEKANRLKSDFLASMSHELRTPINALIGYTALMLDRIYGDINPKQEESLRRIQASAQHLLALINDILDLAKIEAGKMPLHLEEVVLDDLMGEIASQIEPFVRKKELAFECVVPPETPVMFTDRTKVKQILLNLLSNAVKFTHHGAVRVAVTPHGETVRIDVSDTGIGIRREDLDAIWEDFRQLDQSRTREYGGTGLGLSITRRLVERLGGEISLSSEFGAGSTFSVVLPVRSAPLPENAEGRTRVARAD
jgi:PAS domain S-box-containing protein